MGVDEGVACWEASLVLVGVQPRKRFFEIAEYSDLTRGTRLNTLEHSRKPKVQIRGSHDRSPRRFRESRCGPRQHEKNIARKTWSEGVVADYELSKIGREVPMFLQGLSRFGEVLRSEAFGQVDGYEALRWVYLERPSC